ncbi:MAG: hypothetical protein SR2Q5_07000 [Quinella sp. 2Q5]|nr:hypothetical protein [Quinella sp. 2Q5]
MTLIVIALMGALAFLSYQLGKSHRENIEKDRTIREKEHETPQVSPPKKPQVLTTQKPQTTRKPPTIKPAPNPSPKRFVQVIFKKGSHKRYDYFLGNLRGLKVDDFVLVPIRKSKERLDKEIQRMLIEIELTGKIGEKPRKTTCLPAKIKYISKPGEVSEHARSEIIKKLDRKAW